MQQLLGEDAAPAAALATAAAVATAPPPTAPVRDTGERVKISPIARKLAEEFGIDPASVPGSGQGDGLPKKMCCALRKPPEPPRQPGQSRLQRPRRREYRLLWWLLLALHG